MPRLAHGVYQLASGRLQIQWCYDGERYRETLPRGTTLARAIRQRNRELGAAEHDDAPPEPRRTKYDDVMAKLREKHEQLHRRGRLKLTRLDEAFSGLRARKITTTRLSQYVTQRQEAGASDSTIRNELAALRRAFHLAQDAGLVRRVPTFPMPKVQNVRRCYFTPAEFDALLPLIQPAYLRAPVEFAWLTGWRRGNVFGLKWEHVDFLRGVVRVPGGQTKNDEPMETTFTHGSRLAALLREQERVRGRKDPVFVGNEQLRNAWRRAVGPRGLDKWGEQYDPRKDTVVKHRPRFHDLRRSFAQHMIDAGADPNAVMELGGWKTPVMLKRYTINTNDAKRKAQAQRDAYLEAQRQQPRVVDLKQFAAAR